MKLYMLRYAGPCENVTVAVCTSMEKAKEFRGEATKPDHLETVEIEADEFFGRAETQYRASASSPQ